MRLTAAGERFLGRVAGALGRIRQAQREALGGGIATTRALGLAVVEDLESDVAPELAVALARTLPHAKLTLRTEPSHRAIEMIQRRELDMAVASDPIYGADGLIDRVLVRDPFVLAVPAGAGHEPGAYLAGDTPLAFLRRNTRHIIGALIEAHLRRHGVSPPHRFEIHSNQLIMALVASGHGWAITTPIGFGRALRFQGDVALHPLPLRGFARAVSLFCHAEQSQEVAGAIAGILRHLIERMCVRPVLGRFPWLEGALEVRGD